MISSDVRRAIGRAVAAAGLEPADPGLRPTGTPGQYASSVAFAFGEPPGPIAARIVASLDSTDLDSTDLDSTERIARVEVTGPGFITITVPPEVLADLPGRIAAAGPACTASDALRGLTVPAPPLCDPLAAPGWKEAGTALAAQLTARLAAAAGATVALPGFAERSRGSASQPSGSDVAAAVAFAGPDAVRFALARAVPGPPAAIDPRIIARHVPDNPAYAVRYAHARAASELRWAATSHETAISHETATSHAGSLPPREILLDALSWLPERVATAARRGRPDEFARYLEELASATIAALISAGDPGSAAGPGTDRLSLADAARTGLAAGLGLLGVSAPDRLLAEEQS